MKDLLGREVKVGNFIAYALTAGRSANLAVYEVREVFEESIKAIKLIESYEGWGGKYTVTCTNGNKVLQKYTKGKYSTRNYEYIEMTEEEKHKVDNKVTKLSMPERVFILDDFNPSILGK